MKKVSKIEGTSEKMNADEGGETLCDKNRSFLFLRP